MDVVFWNFATGSAVLEVAAVREPCSSPFRRISWKRRKEIPLHVPYKIPKGTYPKQNEDVLTAADGNFLVVNKDMDEDLAYKLVKTTIEHREEIMQSIPQAAHFVPEEASVAIIPFTRRCKVLQGAWHRGTCRVEIIGSDQCFHWSDRSSQE